ncbi:MAG: glycosyltransferase family 39 protein [Xanthobacteraceae bacterium]
MAVAALARRALLPAERLVETLTDPARRESAALVVIVAYVLVWTLYGIIAKSSQDVNFDMAELAAWALHPALGYPKHPPLAAWEAMVWFAVFPRADWAFYLLAVTNVGIALWAAWRLAARWLDGEARVVALALLTLIPLLNFQALKFTPNVVLIPTWALTTLWFLRSYETRKLGDAALAGVAAAAAMLAKYWSVFLLLGLALAVLADPRRDSYFRSLASWTTTVVGAVVLAPHLLWLYEHDFAPFSYAAEAYGDHGLAQAAQTAFTYLAGAAAYTALPVALALAVVRPSRQAVADILWPQTIDRRMVVIAFWLPLLLPALLTLVAGGRTTPLWTMSCWTLLPVVLLASPRAPTDHRATIRVVAFALAFPAAFVLAAPAIAFKINLAGVPHDGAHFRLLAGKLDELWRATTDQPLRIVAGQSDLAYGVAFYLPGPSEVWPDLDQRMAPWIDDAQIARGGAALLCQAEYPSCVNQVAAYAARSPAGRRVEVELARQYFGVPGPSARYLLVTVPPAR